MEENQEELLTSGGVVMGLEAVGIESDGYVSVTSEGAITVTEQPITDDLNTFLSELSQVTRFEYEMLNHQSNIERFSFISMLLMVILIFISAKRNRKITS